MSGSTCASDNYHYTALFTVGSESKLVLNNVSAETDERVVKASGCGEVVVSGGTYNITGINAFLGAAFETKTASFTDMKLTAKYGGRAGWKQCNIGKLRDQSYGYQNWRWHVLELCGGCSVWRHRHCKEAASIPLRMLAYVYSSGGTINIENGTFTGVVRADATTDTTAVINIKNGSFNGEIQKGGGRAARPSPSPAARSALIRARRSRTTGQTTSSSALAARALIPTRFLQNPV